MLVADLVHGLLQLERGQQLAPLPRILPGGRRIPVAEGRPVALRPFGGPVLLLGTAQATGDPMVRGVVEGSQHAGDVAQRAVPGPAIGHRLVGLALEVDDHPAGDHPQRLTKMQVTVNALGRLGGDGGAGGGEDVQDRRQQWRQRRDLFGGPGGRLNPVLPQLAGRLCVRHGGAERGGQVGVHAGHHLTQPVGLGGEVPADLVGSQVALGHQVTDAVGGHRPAVRAAGEERGEQGQGGALTGHRSADLAQRRRHLRAAQRVQGPVHLEIGIRAGGQAPEHLQDRGVSVDDRGVGLFAGQRQATGGAVDRGVGLGAEGQLAELGAVGDQRQQMVGERVIGQRVVAEQIPRLTDQGRSQPLRQRRAPGDPQLVEIALVGGRAGGVGLHDHLFHADAVPLGHRPPGPQHGLQTLAGGREPPLPGQIAGQHPDQIPVRCAHCSGRLRPLCCWRY